MDMATLSPGFADPVLDSQAVFRATLDALSRPAVPVACPRSPEAPAPLYPSTGAVMLALADLDTPVWLDPTLDQPAVRAWLGFHCGCPIVADRALAAFALVGDPGAVPDLEGFALGTADGPDGSATVVIQVTGFDADGGPVFTGPGIRETARLDPEGLPAGFWEDWALNGVLFPQGVDVLFTAPDRLVGLPRTTKGVL
jgi:alpha-D-ribose 1-methylphosphonate 5-triphosphate synthase subunit PhnH